MPYSFSLLTYLPTRLEFIESACLGIVTRHNVANLLSEQPGGALHTSEIAERTGLNQNKIERIMRSLATRHIFREGSYLSIYVTVTDYISDI